MANNLPQFRRTSTTGLGPNTTNSANNAYIPAGSFAINLTDKKVFSSDGTNSFEVGSNVVNKTVTGNLTMATNATRINFTANSTAAGNLSYITLQNDNNLVLYNTATDGSSRPIWSIFTASNTSAFSMSVPLRVGALQDGTGSNGVSGYVLQSNGTSVNWVASTGGSASPGGSNTQIQFNDSGVFGGSAGLTFDKTANTLTVGGNLISNSTSLSITSATNGMTLNPGTIIAASGNAIGIYANNSGTAAILLSANGNIYANNGASAGISLDSNTIVLTEGTRSLTIASTGNSSFSGSNTFIIGTTNITAASGYSWLPSGIMIQWGNVSATTTTGNVTFPTAFPNALFGVNITQSTGTFTTSATAYVSASNTTTCNIRSGSATAKTFFWLAIGN